MSDETYYTVLNIAETASPSEIKAAYRDLIRQVHPDTISNLAPYLRHIAEEKAKEITEAYSVLSSSSKRREYDAQLAVYRRQTNAHTPPPGTQQAAPQSSSGPYCNRCGTWLSAIGFCPSCNKFTAPPETVQEVGRWLGYNWAFLKRFSQKHPILAVAIAGFFFWLIVLLVLSNDTSRQAPAQARVVANTAVSEGTARIRPTVSVSGTYVGTVHNSTANLSSSAAVVLHQTKAGLLEGCMDVKPPLFGSGALRGSIEGAHLSFVVSEITYQGDVWKDEIAGSYGVLQHLGNFFLTKQKGADASYACVNGVLTDVMTVVPPPSSSQQVGARTAGNLEVLSDTRGVDFGPYLSRVLQAVRMNWYNSIPEAARPPLRDRGKVSIEFAILPDGKVADMRITSPSGDVSLDRAAWDGITASNPFAPLPTEFHGPYLALRFRFYYNPAKGDIQ